MSHSILISKNPAQPGFVKIAFRAKPLHAVLFKKEDYNRIQEDLPELEQPGVYVLFGNGKIYIGEADNLIVRLSNHLTAESKKWWLKVFCFHTTLNCADPLNKAMVKYLELKLIAYAKSIGLSIENQALPTEPFLSETDKQILDVEYGPLIIDTLTMFNVWDVEKPHVVLKPEESASTRVPREPSFLVPENAQSTSLKLNEPTPSVISWDSEKKIVNIGSISAESKTTQIQSKHACKIKLDGRPMEAKNWSAMYLQVVEYLVSVHGEELFLKLDPPRISDKEFKKGDKLLAQHQWVDATNKTWYLLTELGTDEKKAAIKKIAAIAGRDLKII